jgi:hypothetical protein
MLCDAPTGLKFKDFTFCHTVFVFCIYLRTNSDLCHLYHKLIGFYNRDEKCFQRGMDWVFKGLISVYGMRNNFGSIDHSATKEKVLVWLP